MCCSLQVAYSSDITYVTGQELGFAYLRDNTAASAQDLVGYHTRSMLLQQTRHLFTQVRPFGVAGMESQRRDLRARVCVCVCVQVLPADLHYAIIDEADSILIDESRNPLIISLPITENEYAVLLVDKVRLLYIYVCVCVCVCMCVCVCVIQLALQSIQTGDSPVSGSQVRTGQKVCVCVCVHVCVCGRECPRHCTCPFVYP